MRKTLSLLLATVILAALLPAAPAAAAQPDDEITILFTHDLHSNFLPFKRVEGGQAANVGGFARLKTLLDSERAGIDALVVDAGDFSMGTLFQTIYTSQASELRMLGRLGYDAVTLGNHEFDFGTSGLTDMLHSVAGSGDRLPQLLFNAGDFPFEKNDAPHTMLEDLSDAFFDVDTQRLMLIEKNGIRVGIFSAFGKESVEYSPTLEFVIPDNIANAKAAVKELRAEGAELIVCLSHSGTKDDPKKSEDELLAKAVPEIDVIVSGHTHTYLYEPIVHGDTVIASCGEYGQYLGKLVLKRNGDRWAVQDYALLPADESVPADAGVSEEISRYKSVVEQQYLSHFDLKFDQVMGRSPFNIPFDVYAQHGESPLGNLIADAYLAAALGAIGPEEEHVYCAVAPAGTIRWGIPQGELTLSDIFNVSSLGVGQDELSGYPLIDLYLTGQELMNVAEVDASVTPLMADAQLFFAGLEFSFNPHRLIFNKVTEVNVRNEQGEPEPPEKERLYRVVCGLFSAQMLGSVKEKSFGILSIVPKDENGEEITDFYARILRDERGAELKEWYAIASYIASFEKDAAGIAVIPDAYAAPQGRKVVEEERGLGAHLTNLNAVSRVVFGVSLLFVLLIAFVIYRLATRRKRKKWKKRAR